MAKDIKRTSSAFGFTCPLFRFYCWDFLNMENKFQIKLESSHETVDDLQKVIPAKLVAEVHPYLLSRIKMCLFSFYRVWQAIKAFCELTILESLRYICRWVFNHGQLLFYYLILLNIQWPPCLGPFWSKCAGLSPRRSFLNDGFVVSTQRYRKGNRDG